MADIREAKAALLVLLAAVRERRDGVAPLYAPEAPAETAPPAAPAATTPEAEASPEPAPPTKPPRRYRPGAMPGDPPAPIVEPETTRILVILELAGAGPGLRPDGTLTIAHAERVSADCLTATRLHKDDIAAILTYRAELERLFLVCGEPLPRQS